MAQEMDGEIRQRHIDSVVSGARHHRDDTGSSTDEVPRNFQWVYGDSRDAGRSVNGNPESRSQYRRPWSRDRSDRGDTRSWGRDRRDGGSTASQGSRASMPENRQPLLNRSGTTELHRPSNEARESQMCYYIRHVDRRAHILCNRSIDLVSHI